MDKCTEVLISSNDDQKKKKKIDKQYTKATHERTYMIQILSNDSSGPTGRSLLQIITYQYFIPWDRRVRGEGVNKFTESLNVTWTKLLK